MLFILVTLMGAGNVEAAEVKNYVFWWPLMNSNWAYRKVLGGVSFMNYSHVGDFETLRLQFKGMIETHKPDLMIVIVDWKDIQPLKEEVPGGGKLPENGVGLSEVIDDNLSLEYFDDLVALARTNGVEVIFEPIVSGYGGQVAYPFSYYSKTGWFWKRPDWQNGLANPVTEVMRYPGADQNGASYGWYEHETGYDKVDRNKWHWNLTTDGVENTGLGNWRVFETPDMVFNGYDIPLHYDPANPGVLPLPIHSPVPSFSSEIYRSTTRELFKKMATHFRNKGVAGYFLFQEPSYAHLREQMNYSSGFTGETESGDGHMYEVDYSDAEKIRYNNWRAAKGVAAVDRIPYPVDDSYNQFREENLADFINNLKLGVKEGDPAAKVSVSFFNDDDIKGKASNMATLFRTVSPEMLTMEPPLKVAAIFENDTSLNQIASNMKSYAPGANTFISFYIDPTRTDVDQKAAKAFNLSSFYVPAVRSSHDASGYALWSPNNCEECQFRYRNPGVFKEIETVATPTSRPVATATPTIGPKCQPCSSGLASSLGNADCNNKIDLIDFGKWKREYIEFKKNPIEKSSYAADFNCNSKVTINGFDVWLENFAKLN